ncbi:hypothetical protein BHE74_00049884, partial [Ensete ventricosum]
ARARRGEARAPRSNPRWRASKRCRLGARPSPGIGRFGRAPKLIQATEPEIKRAQASGASVERPG